MWIKKSRWSERGAGWKIGGCWILREKFIETIYSRKVLVWGHRDEYLLEGMVVYLLAWKESRSLDLIKAPQLIDKSLISVELLDFPHFFPLDFFTSWFFFRARGGGGGESICEDLTHLFECSMCILCVPLFLMDFTWPSWIGVVGEGSREVRSPRTAARWWCQQWSCKLIIVVHRCGRRGFKKKKGKE